MLQEDIIGLSRDPKALHRAWFGFLRDGDASKNKKLIRQSDGLDGHYFIKRSKPPNNYPNNYPNSHTVLYLYLEPTNVWEDWFKINFETSLKSFNEVAYHKGFITSAIKLYEEKLADIIKNDLPTIKRIVLAGYSLGAGAASCLQAVIRHHYDRTNQLSLQVITFGCPPFASMFTSRSKSLYINRNHFSVVCGSDIVANLPVLEGFYNPAYKIRIRSRSPFRIDKPFLDHTPASYSKGLKRASSKIKKLSRAVYRNQVCDLLSKDEIRYRELKRIYSRFDDSNSIRGSNNGRDKKK